MKQGEPTSEMDEPSREEVVKWYKDQIEIAELRHKLTVLQSETVMAEAQRLEALAIMAKFKGEQPTSPDQSEDTDTQE